MINKEKENEPSYYIETNPYRGLFVCLEGIEGSGKSTQTDLIKNYFEQRGISLVVTKEHNENYLKGLEIQKILDGRDSFPTSSLEFQKMYVENRQDHLQKLIIPSLMEDKIVITDRYFWSTIAYGLNPKIRDELIRLNSKFIAPDITIVLDVPPEIGLKRKKHSGESEEIFDELKKQKKILETYQWLKINFKNDIFVISGREDEETVLNKIINLITQHPKFYNSERIKS